MNLQKHHFYGHFKHYNVILYRSTPIQINIHTSSHIYSLDINILAWKESPLTFFEGVILRLFFNTYSKITIKFFTFFFADYLTYSG